ncbi:Uncharacterised protein [Vibrio cholerae]|nr:Uncharacterised protein [Vibrio cholerae]
MGPLLQLRYRLHHALHERGHILGHTEQCHPYAECPIEPEQLLPDHGLYPDEIR